MTKRITPDEAATLIHATTGTSPPTTFSVTFFRKNDGRKGEKKNDLREMVCFLGSNVRKNLAGGPSAYDPTSYRLIWSYVSNLDGAWEEDDRHRRSIAIDGIVKLKINREEYEVSGQPWE